MDQENLEREYKNLLIALSKYFVNLKSYAKEKREEAEQKLGNSSMAIYQRAALYDKQAKGILWIIHQQGAVCENFFGSREPEEIAYHYFEGSGFEIIDSIPVDILGVTKDFRDRLRERGEELKAKVAKHYGDLLSLPESQTD